MSAATVPDVSDRFTTDFIRKTARALIDDGHFARAEMGDLVQELTLAVIESLKNNFDPSRARWTTFVKTVVRRRATSLLRAHPPPPRTCQCACARVRGVGERRKKGPKGCTEAWKASSTWIRSSDLMR